MCQRFDCFFPCDFRGRIRYGKKKIIIVRKFHYRFSSVGWGREAIITLRLSDTQLLPSIPDEVVSRSVPGNNCSKTRATNGKIYFRIHRLSLIMNGKTTDFFDQPRYNINKALMGLIGRWPYQKKTERTFFFALTLCSSISFMTFQVRKPSWLLLMKKQKRTDIGTISMQIRKVVIDSDDTAVIIESVAPFIVHLGCIIKMVTCITHGDKVPWSWYFVTTYLQSI